MTIPPIEESYALLNRYGLHYPSSDAERVDGLTYVWQKLRTQVSETFNSIQSNSIVMSVLPLENARLTKAGSCF